MMGAPPRKAILPGVRPIVVAVFWMPSAPKVCPPGTCHRSTRHQSAWHRSTSHPVTGQSGTGQPGNGQVFTGQQITGQEMTGHQLPVIQSPVIKWLYQFPGTSHWSSSHQSTSHQSAHQAPVITHQKSDKDDPVANKINRSSEQLFPSDPQNCSASKRVLLPLEPDFSHMSDPSIIIAPPSNTWVSDNRHTSSRHSRRDLPENKYKSKRRRHRSSSCSSSSRSSSDSHKRDKRSKRSNFRLLPQELSPRPTEENTPSKPLSGIEHLMENRTSPLLTLPQSKLV